MILCIIPYIVQVFVLIQYILSMSKDVGEISEES